MLSHVETAAVLFSGQPDIRISQKVFAGGRLDEKEQKRNRPDLIGGGSSGRGRRITPSGGKIPPSSVPRACPKNPLHAILRPFSQPSSHETGVFARPAPVPRACERRRPGAAAQPEARAAAKNSPPKTHWRGQGGLSRAALSHRFRLKSAKHQAAVERRRPAPSEARFVQQRRRFPFRAKFTYRRLSEPDRYVTVCARHVELRQTQLTVLDLSARRLASAWHFASCFARQPGRQRSQGARSHDRHSQTSSSWHTTQSVRCASKVGSRSRPQPSHSKPTQARITSPPASCRETPLEAPRLFPFQIGVHGRRMNTPPCTPAP